ncbi:hypothetical protein [Marinimicrobium sp. ARAG 43.8]|uniref:hypothetical protein n=1 Tax=Marinimicrobium sp. ARAG 43.8 TaxID=3418719 RepID=UPI003CF3E769
MYHKLLIALCTLSMLTACGGSDNDGDPSRMILNPPEDLNSGDDDTEDGTDDEDEDTDGEGEEQPPVEWVLQTFETDSAVDAWQFECVSADCNASATFAHNADEQTLDVTPEWTQDGEQLEVFTAIDPEIADMTEGSLFVHLYVPSAYTEAGSMITQVFLKDASDRKGYIGYTTVEAGWNKFSADNLASGTGIDGDHGDFGYHNEGFNLQNINTIGLQFEADAGLVGVNATLQIDDVVLSPDPITVDEKEASEDPSALDPLPAGDESFTFTTGVDGWTNDDSSGSAISHDATAEALVLEPDWANADTGGSRPKAMGVTTNDISEATIRFVVTLTQAQIDDGLQIQPYIQQNSGSYSQEFGGFISDLSAGDNELSWTAPELENAQRFGIQIVGTATDSTDDVVLIKQVEIDLP